MRRGEDAFSPVVLRPRGIQPLRPAGLLLRPCSSASRRRTGPQPGRLPGPRLARRKPKHAPDQPINRSTDTYLNGTSQAPSIVVISAATPKTTRVMLFDLSVSISVNPVIVRNTQKPLSFIHIPTIEPEPIAIST